MLKNGSLFVVLFLVFTLTSCLHKQIEEVVNTYPDDKPFIVRYYQENRITKKREMTKEVAFFMDGSLQAESIYKEGLKNGKMRLWYSKDILFSEAFFVNDTLDGIFTLYHENGAKKSEGHYVKGEKKGTWRYWDDTGAELSTLSY